MKKNSRLLSELAFFVLGLALIGAGIYFAKVRMEFFKNTIPQEGVIVDITSRASSSGKNGKKTSYYPVITFKAKGGKSYTFSPETGTNTAFDYTIGEKIMIQYNEENPQMAKIDSFKERWGLPLALLVVGMIITISMGITVYKIFYQIQLSKELPKSGTRLRLQGLVKTHSLKDKTEYAIISEWLNPADTKIYVFSSDKLGYNPTPYINDRLIDVWIDVNNPKKNHYVDISFLPEKA